MNAARTLAALAALLLIAAPAPAQDGGIAIPTTCAMSLCGDPFRGEYGCWCWGLPRRCWDREVDCRADARCVTADPIHGERRCAAVVKAARDGGAP